jgi:hypothetical protein
MFNIHPNEQAIAVLRANLHNFCNQFELAVKMMQID